MKNNLTVEEQENIILRIIAKEFEVPGERLQDSISLTRDLNADSLSLINVIMRIEEELRIEIPEEEWRSLRTVGDILTRIRTMRPASPSKIGEC
jgi:acyl carrier protein